MATILSYFTKLFGTAGAAVDAAIPAATGNRTIIAVFVGFAAKVIPTVLPLIPEPYHAAVVAALPLVMQLSTTLAPLFAMAHLARAK